MNAVNGVGGGIQFAGANNGGGGASGANNGFQMEQRARNLAQYMSPENGAQRLGISVDQFKQYAGLST